MKNEVEYDREVPIWAEPMFSLYWGLLVDGLDQQTVGCAGNVGPEFVPMLDAFLAELTAAGKPAEFAKAEAAVKLRARGDLIKLGWDPDVWEDGSPRTW